MFLMFYLSLHFHSKIKLP